MILHAGKLKGYIVEQVSNYVVVISPKGQSYLIPTGSGVPIRCSCKGYTYNNKCKHIEFAHTLELSHCDSIPMEKIGPWTSQINDYAEAYKLSVDKEEFYLTNKVPKP